MKLGLLLVVIVGGLFYSCTYKKYEVAYPQAPKDSIISYAATIVPLNNAKCNGCHVPQGTGNGDFSTYAGVMVKVSNNSFYQRVVVTKDMPTLGSGYDITDEQRHYYELWLKQGAQNN